LKETCITKPTAKNEELAEMSWRDLVGEQKGGRGGKLSDGSLDKKFSTKTVDNTTDLPAP